MLAARPPAGGERRAAPPDPRDRLDLARLEAGPRPARGEPRGARRGRPGLRPLGAAATRDAADDRGDGRRARARARRCGLGPAARGRQLDGWLARARAGPPRPRLERGRDLARGDVDREGARVLAQLAPPPARDRHADRALRRPDHPYRARPDARPGQRHEPSVADGPRRRGRCAAPLRGRARLGKHARGHDERHAARARLDRLPGADRLGHARHAAAATPGGPLRARDPGCRAGPPARAGARADGRRLGSRGRLDPRVHRAPRARQEPRPRRRLRPRASGPA